MLAAYISHADCLLHEMGDGHPECPARLAAINDRLIAQGLLDVMEHFDAPLVSMQALARVHSEDYLQRIFSLSPGEGYLRIDPDTLMNPHTLQAARRAAGAAVLATDLVVQGKHRIVFCNVRPPGHHATIDEAMGFCFFNNVAVGIRHALEHHQVQRVALIDFDVHHGNGSESVFYDDERVLMCSTYQIDIFPFHVAGEQSPRRINIGLPARSRGELFQKAVEDHWLDALDRFRPELIYISAGFDGHVLDDMGGLGLLERDFAWVTRQMVHLAEKHAGGRVISCLEGGYELDVLARSASSHVKALLGLDV
ncbi:MAG: hypothetical protein RL539_965 [Pseudomonadota bacterium]